MGGSHRGHAAAYVGVVSFIVPELAERQGLSWLGFPPAVRGLVAVVLLVDLYTIYQQ
jgi:hypothetical protein